MGELGGRGVGHAWGRAAGTGDGNGLVTSCNGLSGFGVPDTSIKECMGGRGVWPRPPGRAPGGAPLKGRLAGG